jgi:hypothetical protein
MSKESLQDRINFYKKETENQRQADLTSRQQQQEQEKEKQRQEEIKKRLEIQEIVSKTKENFAGTGILEAFQEIIDSRTLTFASTREEVEVKKGIFGRKWEYSYNVIPAKIEYNLDQICLIYKLDEYSGDDYCAGGYSRKSIIVEKKEADNFQLTVYKEGYGYCSPITSTGNSEKIIENIARFIANTEYHLLHGMCPKYADGTKALIEYNRELDRRLTGQ